MKVHDFNQEAASDAISALDRERDTEALVVVGLAIADRLADLVDVFAAAAEEEDRRYAERDGNR